jgi:cytochrome c biogenesis protein CcmG/thiol:disulfide interchange protein DsbE
MTAKSRSARRRAAREQQERQTATRWLLPAVGALVAVVAIVAVVLSQSGSGGGGEASGAPSASPVVVAAPQISGSALPALADPNSDAAVGMIAPTVSGHDYSGNAVSIAPTGKPMLVIFAAHWCPHCQREIPLIQQWINEGKAPTDVDLRSVSTGITPTAPNYPPEAWFQRVGWTVPLVVDPTNSVAQAYGLSSYPFFVLLDGKGNVVQRFTGEITMDQLGQILAAAPRS